jgi:hypothetical protein
MTRRTVNVAVIIPDASPVLTLARIDRLDLFETFSVPIEIVDQVHDEITRSANDPDGTVSAWLRRMGDRIAIIETNVGVGFRTRRSRDPTTPSGHLGEIAVDEYATHLALTASPAFVPLVLFEDPDVLETRIARLPRVHLLNTAAWIRALADEGVIPDGQEVLDQINAQRKSPMLPLERPGRTKRFQSRWMRKARHDVG